MQALTRLLKVCFIFSDINAQSDGLIDAFIRRNAETVYHNTSTCKMGDPADNMAVVDNETRVFGIEGLRVVDASIMPSLNSGNTNAPTIMIAEKAADMILGKDTVKGTRDALNK